MATDIIFGRNPVLEALRSGRSIQKILISEQLNKRAQTEIVREAKKAQIELVTASVNKLDSLVKGRHQGMIAYVATYDYVPIDTILQRAEKKDELPFLIILDGIEDPHNLGAILRTAEATGVHGVIIPKHRAVGLTNTVAKTSAGAIEHVPVARVTNIVKTMKELKAKNIWMIGTDDAGSDDYRTIDGETPIALVIGNEGKGMSRLVRETCDWTVHIPMQGNIPSLNASVATSILLYEVYRKRNELGK